MTTPPRRARWRSAVARAIACGLVFVLACPLIAGDKSKAIPHIRSTHRDILAMLRDGCRRSATLQHLVQEVEASDVIVYIEATNELPRSMQAYIQLAGAGPQLRFVRVVLRIPASTETILAELGHELQHATEIARAREVRDQAAVEALYRRIGDESGAGWDTPAARATGGVVLAELRRASSVVNAALPANEAGEKPRAKK